MFFRYSLTRRPAQAQAWLGWALAFALILTSVPSIPARKASHGSASAVAFVHARSSDVKKPNLERLPLAFAPNAGQFDKTVKYYARGFGGAVFFKADKIVFQLPSPRVAEQSLEHEGTQRDAAHLNLSLRFEGARTQPEVVGQNELPGTLNYFTGSDPRRWRANLPTFKSVAYKQIYSGIDLRYDGVGGELKSAYLVSAGADPSRIRWRYEGTPRVRVDAATGDLRIGLPAGTTDAEVIERAPVAWQELGGRRVFVQARYAVADDGSVSFALGHYDRARPLVIDPTLAFSYYVGGQGQDFAQAVALDADNNIYITGVTSSPNFPQAIVPAGAQLAPGGQSDAFVIKLDPTGSMILYSTYLGGDEADWGLQIALDSSRSAHVTGYTRSTNFPTQNALQNSYGGGQTDAFITKLSADGRTLLYSTYLGGSEEDVAYAVSVGGDGQAAVTGYTRSSNFPTMSARQAGSVGLEDAFVAKLSASGGALTYSTYFGGSGSDYGQAIATDRSGNLYVAGHTTSTNFPLADALQTAKGGYEDAFITKLKPDGSAPIFSTYLGGSDSDFANAIAVDVWGHVYLTGSTRSTDFPAINPFQAANGGGDDAFVTKLDRKGNRLRFSTYLGGAGDDYGLGIAVDRGYFPTITGRTKSANFPVANAIQPAISSDSHDAFVSRLTAAGSALDMSTFLGGNDREIGEGVANDAAGNLYVTGYTYSTDFHNTRVGPEPYRGFLDEDAFILKLNAPTPAAAQCGATSNVALASNGGTATASSVYDGRDYSPSGAIDGDRKGTNWEQGGGWNDNTRDVWPDTLEVTFDDVKSISEVRVYTLQDNFKNPQEPSPTMTALFYGLMDFDVEFWDGTEWRRVTGGSVTGNTLVMRVFNFDPVTTDRVRIVVRNARVHYSRIVEVEAFGCDQP